MRANAMIERGYKKFGVILAFDVPGGCCPQPPAPPAACAPACSSLVRRLPAAGGLLSRRFELAWRGLAQQFRGKARPPPPPHRGCLTLSCPRPAPIGTPTNPQ